MKSLKEIYKIKAPIEKVWDALTNAKTIEKWGGGPVKMKAVESSEFSFWGGDIKGINTKVIKEKELSQEWMSGDWDKYSKVNFKLNEKEGVTTVELTQSGIPDKEFMDIKDGWNRYYLGEIKALLEK
ncbi:MAG TPA: SRPBCC domain-containing protein [Patescibacteria group bacterium]|nr:SRPBCC domain-containing protein [Patescibacteria group bacterium]